MSKSGPTRRRGIIARSDRLGPWPTALLCVGGALALVTGLFSIAASEVGAVGGTAPTAGWTGATAPLPAQPSPDVRTRSRSSSTSPASRGVLRAGRLLQHGHGKQRLRQHPLGREMDARRPCPCRPAPRRAFVGTIADVTCTTDQVCVGVGAFGDPSSNDQAPLVSTYANGQWTSTAVTLPNDAASSNQTAVLGDVSCLSPTSCVAAGSYNTNAGGNPLFGLLATLTGTTWSAVQAPEPADAVANQHASLAAISCPAPSNCVAVGDYRPSVSASTTVAEVLTSNNGTWSAQTPILPTDTATGAGVTAFFNSVSCSVGQCEAGGEYTDSAASVRVCWRTSWRARSRPSRRRNRRPQHGRVDRACEHGSGFLQTTSRARSPAYAPPSATTSTRTAWPKA